MEDESKMFIWEWEDGETGEIRTIKIPMPNLDRDYDQSRDHSRSKAPPGQRGKAGLDRDRPAEKT